jgi:hypothetical protein
MSIRSAVGYRDKNVPVGEENLEQVLTNGNTATRKI